MSQGLTEEDREKLAEIAEVQKAKGNGKQRFIDESCRDVREAYKNGDTIPDLAEEQDVITDTIITHITGRCSCENDEEPIEVTVYPDTSIEVECDECEADFNSYGDLTRHINLVH